METVISISNLTKKFGKFTALDGVDLNVKKGEIFGFIGPNGAGKTTTIRTLLGIIKASSGDVKVFDKDAWHDNVAIHKKIAYVPGDVNLWDNLTGGEVIGLFMKLQGNENKAKVDQLIKKFDFDPTKKCGSYSKGNRQKVALIAALASDAELFILDEPTSGLDPLMERMFKECIEEIKNEGKTVFLSSHILSEVEELCDRISIIRNGKIVDTGTLDQLRHLSRISVELKTERKIDNLDRLQGVSDIELIDGKYYFKADKDNIGSIISYIDKYGILDIQATPPSLEELFLTHYKEDGEK